LVKSIAHRNKGILSDVHLFLRLSAKKDEHPIKIPPSTIFCEVSAFRAIKLKA
jgi:hypothetical protein